MQILRIRFRIPNTARKEGQKALKKKPEKNPTFHVQKSWMFSSWSAGGFSWRLDIFRGSPRKNTLAFSGATNLKWHHTTNLKKSISGKKNMYFSIVKFQLTKLMVWIRIPEQ
jgi:hypothetical protein